MVVSGLPGSGKTTLARLLAPVLNLPLIDKDDILETLFTVKGTGDSAWRRALSRESDVVVRRDASASQGAVVVSFWHLPGMPEDSGTPTGWLRSARHRLVHVRCVCDTERAAARFHQRRRHPGHRDGDSSFEQVLAGLRELARLGPLDLGAECSIDVDTTSDYDVESIGRRILA